MRHSPQHRQMLAQSRTLLGGFSQTSAQIEARELRGRLRRSRWITGFLCLSVFVLLAGNVTQLALWTKQPEIQQALLSEIHQNSLARRDQLARLKVEIERLRSRQVANKGTINLQFQQIYNQQVQLSKNQNFVRSLAMMARELGFDAHKQSLKPVTANANPLSVSSLPVKKDGRRRGTIDPIQIEYDLIRMHDESLLAVTALSEQINERAQLGEKTLKSLDIKVPTLPQHQRHRLGAAIGGPFVPLHNVAGGASDRPYDPFIKATHSAMNAMDRLKSLKKTVAKFPLLQPLKGKNVRSSGYGPRQDPFLNKRSFHAGVDFAARTGTPVLAAGKGKVIFAGSKGGYGNMVEIRHMNGYTTRYAHLSDILVRKGDWVHAHAFIGRVGSTGRSTGPHLHYEVRHNDMHLNPTPFLRAGKALKKADLF